MAIPTICFFLGSFLHLPQHPCNFGGFLCVLTIGELRIWACDKFSKLCRGLDLQVSCLQHHYLITTGISLIRPTVKQECQMVFEL